MRKITDIQHLSQVAIIFGSVYLLFYFPNLYNYLISWISRSIKRAEHVNIASGNINSAFNLVWIDWHLLSWLTISFCWHCALNHCIQRHQTNIVAYFKRLVYFRSPFFDENSSCLVRNLYVSDKTRDKVAITDALLTSYLRLQYAEVERWSKEGSMPLPLCSFAG